MQAPRYPLQGLTAIDAAVLADLGEGFPAEFAAADPTTQRAVVGYFNVYAGPWGLKASEEDAVLGIIRALWPEWVEGEPSGAIYKFRADERLGRIADELFEDDDVGTTCALIARTVTQLRATGLFDVEAAAFWANLDEAARSDYPSFSAFADDFAHRNDPKLDVNVWIEVHGTRQGFGTIQEAITALQDEQVQDRIITEGA